MARITSFLVRVSGLVTFSDQTSSVFHVQSDDTQSWSIDVSESFGTTSQIGSNTSFYDILSQALGYTWTNRANIRKTITDMIARTDITFALDDGTTNYAAMVIQGQNTNTKGRISTNEPAINIVPDSFSVSLPTNIVAFMTKIQTDLGLIMSGVSTI